MNFKALQAGALDVVSKPRKSQFGDVALQKQFLRKIHLLAEIPVVTRRGGYTGLAMHSPRVELGQPRAVKRHVRLLAIGASTGGPPALQVLLSSLEPDPPYPVLVVQHMSAGFIGGLADWLSHSTGREVVLAEQGIRPEPGIVYLAPDRYHMEFRNNAIRLTGDGPETAHCPSVDVLFESIAADDIVGNTIAVILTGMGNDGAAGIDRIHQRGAWTIAQDKSTSVVFGMPQVAIEKGAVSEVVPLERIGERINMISTVKDETVAVNTAEAEKGMS
jgi:two-component system chemotaxis response regulator CheB